MTCSSMQRRQTFFLFSCCLLLKSTPFGTFIPKCFQAFNWSLQRQSTHFCCRLFQDIERHSQGLFAKEKWWNKKGAFSAESIVLSPLRPCSTYMSLSLLIHLGNRTEGKREYKCLLTRTWQFYPAPNANIYHNLSPIYFSIKTPETTWYFCGNQLRPHCHPFQGITSRKAALLRPLSSNLAESLELISEMIFRGAGLLERRIGRTHDRPSRNRAVWSKSKWFVFPADQKQVQPRIKARGPA